MVSPSPSSPSPSPDPNVQGERMGDPPEPQPPKLQLLLFVEHPTNVKKETEKLQEYLDKIFTNCSYGYDLQSFAVGEVPHFVEHFRLVLTPALVKLSPDPQQIFTGSRIEELLEQWWPRWFYELEELDIKLRRYPGLDTVELSKEETQKSVQHHQNIMVLSDRLFKAKQEQERLIQQIQFKDQVLEILAHDLRNPLTSLSLALQTIELLDERDHIGTQDHVRKQVKDQAKQQLAVMQNMITALLQTSKSLGGKLELELAPLNLVTFFEEIATEIQKNCEAKHQELTLDIPHNTPAVMADGAWLHHVVMNLADNAVKYTPDGGHIKISIFHRTLQQVQISVIDDGLGIPAEQQHSIFEGHFRLKRDRATDGFGVGLALCRRVVLAHQGKIWVDSHPRQGSAFHFTLPIA